MHRKLTWGMGLILATVPGSVNRTDVARQDGVPFVSAWSDELKGILRALPARLASATRLATNSQVEKGDCAVLGFDKGSARLGALVGGVSRALMIAR